MTNQYWQNTLFASPLNPMLSADATASNAFEDAQDRGALAGVTSTGGLSITVVDASGATIDRWQIEGSLLTISGKPVGIRKVVASTRRVGEFRKADKAIIRCTYLDLIASSLALFCRGALQQFNAGRICRVVRSRFYYCNARSNIGTAEVCLLTIGPEHEVRS